MNKIWIAAVIFGVAACSDTVITQEAESDVADTAPAAIEADPDAAAAAETISDSDAAGPVLTYADAFVMEPIGGRDMTMGGVTLSAEGGDVSLTAARSDSFGTIEMHTMSMEDGKMQMRMVDGFDIADGESLELKRGGNHFMMFDVAESVVAGETVSITLNFDAAGQSQTLEIEADVRAVGE